MAHLQKTHTKPKVSPSTKSHSHYILLVEDEPTHAIIIRHVIQAADPNALVKVADSLREYRDFIEKSLPDIVLMDIHLPDGKALEVLKSPPESGPFPIVVMTSMGDERPAGAGKLPTLRG